MRQVSLASLVGRKAPQGKGITNQLLPSVAAVEEQDVANETVEAYTGNHVSRRGDRTPLSLDDPDRYNEADGEGSNVSEAETEAAVKW